MIENKPVLTFLAYLTLFFGLMFLLFPIWTAFVASTKAQEEILTDTLTLLPGSHFFENYNQILFSGYNKEQDTPILLMLKNSLIMALSISIGKIIISYMAAFAIIYFRFPFRKSCFWLIFITLMLPVEVRILPTFQVVSNLNMLNSYAGLAIPLIASATATFLFRQFFMTIPEELLEAAKIDGATPFKFMKDILLPLSKVNITALFVIMFIYGWNQYLWPLIVTTEENFYTVVMGVQRIVRAAKEEPNWHLVMAVALVGLLPPFLVVVIMQKYFVKGLIDTEK